MPPLRCVRLLVEIAGQARNDGRYAAMTGQCNDGEVVYCSRLRASITFAASSAGASS